MIVSEDRHYVVMAPSEGMVAVVWRGLNTRALAAVLTLTVNGAEVRARSAPPSTAAWPSGAARWSC